MEGDIVKAAWVLGGSIVASTALAGVGLLLGGLYLSSTAWRQLDVFSQRAANAVMDAPKNTTVAFDKTHPIMAGFDTKLPVAVRVENSMNDSNNKRAVFEVEVKPTLNK